MAQRLFEEEYIKQAAELLKKEHSERLRFEKVAADLELEKRAQRLAFREVELGLSEPFRTMSEFQTKVASLMQEDLNVVEKAIELGYGSARKGGELVGETKNQQRNPLEAWVLTGDLEG